MSTHAPQWVTMGELLIDFMAEPSGQILDDAERFVRKPGGAPANVAVGMTRLGQRAAFVGMVGNDAFGRFLRKTLEAEQVDTRGLKETSAQPTTLAFVSKDQRGVPSFSFYRHPGADLSLRPEDVDEAVFTQARGFHFGSLSLVASPAHEATLHCLRLARQRELLVSYDPNYRPALWPDEATARQRMFEPLDQVDLLKVSEEELRLLSGEQDLTRGCETLAQSGPKIIVVTRGERGLFGWNHGQIADIPGQPVNVVDTTGCGDSSVAGLLTWFLESGVPLTPQCDLPQEIFEQALAFANRCAAITATREGAIPALPRRDEVQ